MIQSRPVCCGNRTGQDSATINLIFNSVMQRYFTEIHQVSYRTSVNGTAQTF